MFTGIVDHCGTILEIMHLPNACRMKIQTHFNELVLGESIAVDGICLTVTEINNNYFCCDLSPETLNITTAKNFKINKPVNLERALQLSSRLGGHFVTGHVDGTAAVMSIQKINEFVEMRFVLPAKTNVPHIIKKGSIAINGVSLTINEVFSDGFNVMLIPHTLEKTNLATLSANDLVNIEYDMMAKLILEQMKKYLNAETQG